MEVCRDGKASVREAGTTTGKALHSSFLEDTAGNHTTHWPPAPGWKYNQRSNVPLSPSLSPLTLWWPSVWWNWPITPSPYGSSLPPPRQDLLARLTFALAIGHLL